MHQSICTSDVQRLVKHAGFLFLHGIFAAFILSNAESGIEKLALKESKVAYNALSPALNASETDYELSCLTSNQRQILESYSESPPPGNWNYPSAVFFCITLVTTIGYGTFSAQTTIGKVYTCVLAIVGVAQFGYVLRLTGAILTRFIRLKFSEIQLEEVVV